MATLIALPMVPALGQDPAARAGECAAGPGASYTRCALWIDGPRVRQGAEGVVIGKPGFFRPLRLTRLVQGDSALHYARGFERNTARAGGFAFLSLAFGVAAIVVIDAYDCNRDAFLGVCTNSDDESTLGAVALLAGGLVTGI
ncbi:MAG TPA: hypothetical protein VFV33_24600, partial [Gemmatimonadaceae bacterium]|nr:hypothetical protein [Gemmatimonadaceae bacterium]